MADKNIIDGIEYETEPHPDYLIDGKPVYYAKNVPELLRGKLELTEEQRSVAVRLENMSVANRALRGAEDWNLWVVAYRHMWTNSETSDDKVRIWLRSSEDHGGVEKWLSFSDGADHFHDPEGVKRYRLHIANFKKFVFPMSVDFRFFEFASAVRFGGAVFLGKVRFNNAVFRSSLFMKKAVFLDQIRFTKAVFHDTVDGSGALFLDLVSFGGARFYRSLNLNSCVFFQQATFINTHFEGSVDLDHVQFGVTSAMLPKSEFRDLDGSLLRFLVGQSKELFSNNIPRFKGAKFDVTPNLGFTNIVTPSLQAKHPMSWAWRFFGWGVVFRRVIDDEAASKLRRLQEMAANGHHHLAEKRFFRSELLCRRGWEADTPREVAMINAFELFSKCGLSFWRPVFWLGFLVLLSALFYWSQISWPAGESGPFELASYSFANSLPLLGYISDSYDVSVNVLFGGVDKVPPGVRVWAFFQNAVSAVLIFFALLAIRNYFKLG